MGYVANPGAATYQISGMVTFSFDADTVTEHSSLQINTDAIIPPGQTVLAAQMRLPFTLSPLQKCRFEPGSSLRKISR